MKRLIFTLAVLLSCACRADFPYAEFTHAASNTPSVGYTDFLWKWNNSTTPKILANFPVTNSEPIIFRIAKQFGGSLYLTVSAYPTNSGSRNYWTYTLDPTNIPPQGSEYVGEFLTGVVTTNGTNIVYTPSRLLSRGRIQTFWTAYSISNTPSSWTNPAGRWHFVESGATGVVANGFVTQALYNVSTRQFILTGSGGGGGGTFTSVTIGTNVMTAQAIIQPMSNLVTRAAGGTNYIGLAGTIANAITFDGSINANDNIEIANTKHLRFQDGGGTNTVHLAATAGRLAISGAVDIINGHAVPFTVNGSAVATGTPLYVQSETNANARLQSNVWAAADSTTNYVARTGGTYNNASSWIFQTGGGVGSFLQLDGNSAVLSDNLSESFLTLDNGQINATIGYFSGSGAGLNSIPLTGLLITNTPNAGDVLATSNGTNGYWTAQTGGGGGGDNLGNHIITNHMIPNSSNTWDIGSSNFPIRDLYVSADSLHIGSYRLSANESGIVITNLVITNNIFAGGGGNVTITNDADGKAYIDATVGNGAELTNIPLTGLQITNTPAAGDVLATSDGTSGYWRTLPSAGDGDMTKAEFGDPEDGTGIVQTARNAYGLWTGSGTGSDPLTHEFFSVPDIAGQGFKVLALNGDSTAFVWRSFDGGAYTLPTVDGSAGYVLQTDGAGSVTWASPSGGSQTPWTQDIFGNNYTATGVAQIVGGTSHLIVNDPGVDEGRTGSNLVVRSGSAVTVAGSANWNAGDLYLLGGNGTEAGGQGGDVYIQGGGGGVRGDIHLKAGDGSPRLSINDAGVSIGDGAYTFPNSSGDLGQVMVQREDQAVVWEYLNVVPNNKSWATTNEGGGVLEFGPVNGLSPFTYLKGSTDQAGIQPGWQIDHTNVLLFGRAGTDIGISADVTTGDLIFHDYDNVALGQRITTLQDLLSAGGGGAWTADQDADFNDLLNIGSLYWYSPDGVGNSPGYLDGYVSVAQSPREWNADPIPVLRLSQDNATWYNLNLSRRGASGAAADGDVMVYDDANKEWHAAAPQFAIGDGGKYWATNDIGAPDDTALVLRGGKDSGSGTAGNLELHPGEQTGGSPAVGIIIHFGAPATNSITYRYDNTVEVNGATALTEDLEVISPDGTGLFVTNVLHFKHGLYTGKTTL